MDSIFKNNRLLVALSIIIAIIGLLAGYTEKDFMWFARSGSLVVAIGILLISRTSFTGRDLLTPIIGAGTEVNVNSPDHFKKLGEPVPKYVLTDVEARNAIGKLGPLVTFAGTIIWGFGDLLNKVFEFMQ